MIKKRIITVLLLKNKKLIHRINFDETTDTYVGDPINAINIFNQYQIDEMAFIDISKKNSEIDYELLKEITSEAFFPISYGGNIHSLESAKKVINIGFEKIILNSVLLKNPRLVNELVNYFGAQSIIASIDVFSNGENIYIYD